MGSLVSAAREDVGEELLAGRLAASEEASLAVGTKSDGSLSVKRKEEKCPLAALHSCELVHNVDSVQDRVTS